MNTVRRWIKNARSIALAQSLMPAILAVVLAAGQSGFSLWMALLAVLGVGAAHLSLNLADDYYDYRVDMLSDRERVIRQGFRAMMVKYPYLTDGSESEHTLFRAVVSFGMFALCCGLPIFVMRTLSGGFAMQQGSWWMLLAVLGGAVLGLFYSAPPLKLGYRGLGELVIGVIFGPLLMIGTYYSACGHVDGKVLWISIPVGLLVLNILYTHSFIEKESDKASNKMTFARLLGSDAACLVAAFLFNLLPFAMVVLAVVLRYIHPLYLIVLLMLPRAIWLCRSLLGYSRGKTEVPERPPLWLGMMKDWDAVKAAGVDWFLMRWLCARNIISGFCLLVIVADVILKFI